MKNLIFVFACLSISVFSFAQENQPLLNENQKKQFADIDQYIDWVRSEMQLYYQYRLIEMDQHVQSEIALLEIPNNYYADLAEQNALAISALNIDFIGLYWPLHIIPRASRLFTFDNELYNDYYYNFHYNNYCLNGYSPFRDYDLFQNRRFAALQSQIIDRKSHITTQQQWYGAKLQQQTQYTLSVTIPQFEQQLKNNISNPPSQIQTTGLLTGIVYTENRPSAIIDHQIVHNGDTLHGVKVAAIYKDQVEFEKNGQKWQQTVNQPPAEYWK